MADTVIRVENVTRTYHVGDVDVQALRGVSLTVERGEFVAIMGLSGSGKSNAQGHSGAASTGHPAAVTFFEGIDVAGLPEPALARIRSERLDFVFQSFNLLARTSASENVALPLLYAPQRPPSRSVRLARARVALTLLEVRRLDCCG
jgi:ABC-type lipoprotein export system ATPase subunit